MIPLTVVQGYSTALSQLSVAALATLRDLLASVADESPEMQRAVLFEAFPEVFNPYAAASAAVSASFFEEVRDLVGVGGQFAAQTLDIVETPKWSSLVGWGTQGSVFERGGQALMFALLSGGLQRVLTEHAADTIIGNAAMDESATWGYQRVPSPGCCAFCGLLASRGAAYDSEESAGAVVGRGKPVGSHKLAKGIRSRGARALGEGFHDSCRCTIVPVNAGNHVQMQEDADKYLEAYAEARNTVSADRRAEGYQGFGDQATSTKMILAEMRQSLGVN